MPRLVFAAALFVLSSACLDRPLAEVEPRPSTENLSDITLDTNRDFDILYIVDNSLSMETEQDSLAQNFPRIIDALTDAEEGLPSIHVAVITTDVGAGASCGVNLNAGNMVGQGCGGLDGAFIKDIANEDGTRSRNYTGSLADTFACMADVGTSGCGFEQPLQAMRLALDGNPNNTGFIRPHAYLAVIFVTDEDDCSGKDPSMYASEYVGLEHPLGPRESFRCFEFGVTCDQGDLRSPGAKENCVPDEDSAYMHKVTDYIGFLKGLKASPNQIVVGAISGELTTPKVRHILDPNPGGNTPVMVAELEPSCENGNADAVTPIRLNGFLQAFPTNKLTSICDEDLTVAVEQIADAITVPFVPCITGELADTDPSTPELDVQCTVSEVRNYGTPQQTEHVVPACADTTVRPCYSLRSDAICSAHPTGLALEVTYADGVVAPPGTHAVVRCLGK